jgi:POT family proton-dependent oligopeptide transporter
MVVAALIQHFIYEKSPCGKDASSCDDAPPLTVWAQAPVRGGPLLLHMTRPA